MLASKSDMGQREAGGRTRSAIATELVSRGGAIRVAASSLWGTRTDLTIYKAAHSKPLLWIQG